MIVLIVLDHLTTSNYLSLGQNYAKWGQFCRKKGENLDFSLLFQVWVLEYMHDITDYDSTDGSGP